MKKRIWGIIWAFLGIGIALPGVLSAVHVIGRLPKPGLYSPAGSGIVAFVRYYDLRWEILLVAAGLVSLLAACILLLSPVRRRVPLPEQALSPDTSDPAEALASNRVTPSAAQEPLLECILHTRILGTTFVNENGSSRQSILASLAVGDMVVCRSIIKNASDSVGVFTLRGKQIGYLDASFVRAMRECYPNRRIGVRVEQLSGGSGIPYTCDVRVAVYRK